MHMRRGAGLILVGLVLLAAGCGGSSRRCALSGTVTFKGEPLDQATIQFYAAGPTSGALAGDLLRQGKYSIPPGKGLEPGTYRVVISAPEPVKDFPYPATGQMPVGKERIPPEYNAKTKLTVEVQADGPNQFDFVIP